MSQAAIFLLVLLLIVGGALALLAFVRAERAERQPMDRASAERTARRDTTGERDRYQK